MDSSQRYQSLSYALHPVSASSTSAQYSNTTPLQYPSDKNNNDDDDEVDAEAVKEQLGQEENDHGHSAPSTPAQEKTTVTAQSTAQNPEQPVKRRPGRPRGSKNRKPSVQQTAPAPTGTTAPGQAPYHHPEVTPQNQQYYEFQWRVLNLCAEFYGTAEELIKSTPPLVMHQCYQMSPTSSIDPLSMVTEAKKICDQLIANPSRLITQPPPPMYPVIPQYYQPPAMMPPPPQPGASNGAPVINQPQSFVVSMGGTGQYPMYPPGGAPYYPYGYPGTYYGATPAPQAQGATSQTATPQKQAEQQTSSSPAPTIATSLAGVGSNQGAWSEDELARLKQLAEQSREAGNTGDAEWDWVVQQWGNSRTRHQILIQATKMGLKESTTRVNKRRRDEEDEESPRATQPPHAPTSSSTSTLGTNSSPRMQSQQTQQTQQTQATQQTQNRSVPASPALNSPQSPAHRTPSAASNTTPKMPWPMPTVAANTPPVINASNSSPASGSSSYYRPRPTNDQQAKPLAGPVQHQQWYHSNGR